MKTILNALLFCLIILPATLMAQSTVTGSVTDKANAMPLPGVNVIIKGTSRGTSTDFDGKYSIELSEGEVLHLSRIPINTSFAFDISTGTANKHHANSYQTNTTRIIFTFVVSVCFNPSESLAHSLPPPALHRSAAAD